MKNIDVILLVVIALSLIYVFWKRYKTKEYEDLLFSKQKEQGRPVLMKHNFKKEYSFVSVMVLVFVLSFSLGSDFKLDNLFMMKEEQIHPEPDPIVLSTEREILNSIVETELSELVNEDLQGIYLVAIDDIRETVSYTQNFANVSYIDVTTYSTNIRTVDFTTSELLLGNTEPIAMKSLALNSDANLIYSYEETNSSPISLETVYLIFATHISDDNNSSINDDRLDSEEYLFPLHIFALEGYDMMKPIGEQDEEVLEEILRLIEYYGN